MVMRILLYLILLFCIASCSTDPNQYYIDKVAEQVRKNDMGLKVSYRNVEFTWIDTLYITGADGKLTDTVLGYLARNKYRLIVGEIDKEVTATVTFDHDFNVIEIK